LRTAAVPFSFLGVLVLIGPAIGMPRSLPPAPELAQYPPAAEQALAAVVNHRLAAPPARALTQLTQTPVSTPAEAGAARLRPDAWSRALTQALAPAPVAAATVRPTAPARTAVSIEASEPRTHIVQDGDNLWAISRRYDVTVDALARANDLTADSTLRLGKELSIPAAGSTTPVTASPSKSAPRTASASGSTVTHVVQPGDTLWSIAARYGTKVDDVMARNNLDDSDKIRPGQRLEISGRALPRHRQVVAQSRTRLGSKTEPEMADTVTLRAAGTFLWPSRGVLTSRFGPRYRRHHDGIDIAAPRGTPIYASRDGVVEFAGRKKGYGLVVFVNHGDGLVTVYGHASSLLVETGQTVKKGQLLARVGCTGVCTGSHLHFEVREDGRAQNPLQYLQ
jgi:murein DD-endopeptidase MepM/ murein hydrolase activator NlpD